MSNSNPLNLLSYAISGKHYTIVQGPPNTFLFGKSFKKNYWIFSQFLFFYLKVEFFRLIMENNFIQMAASDGHAVAYMIGPIFNNIIDCV